MQLLLFSKNSSDTLTPVNFEIGSGQSNKIPDVCGGKGNVCLISQSAYVRLSKVFARTGFIDCGREREKV